MTLRRSFTLPENLGDGPELLQQENHAAVNEREIVGTDVYAALPAQLNMKV